MARIFRWVSALAIISASVAGTVSYGQAQQEIAAQAAPPPYPTPDFSTMVVCPVSRVIDGDTVELVIENKPVQVHLAGVDAPESSPAQQGNQAYATEALSFAQNLLTGESVWVEMPAGQNTDCYGRTVRFLFRCPDGLFVNLEILRQGYGLLERSWPHQYLELFQTYQAMAQATKRGLWGDLTPRNAAAQKSVSGLPPLAVAAVKAKQPVRTSIAGMPPAASDSEKYYADGGGTGKNVYVRGYYRKDGTYVHPHYRRAPRR
jgi:endonuclease YncB( thermonuclease family)